MDWKSMFIPLFANAFLTFLHHALYVRPAQLKIKALSDAQNAQVAGVVGAVDSAVINAADNVVVKGAEKLSGK